MDNALCTFIFFQFMINMSGHTSTTLRPNRQRKGHGEGIPSLSPHSSSRDHHNVDDDDTTTQDQKKNKNIYKLLIKGIPGRLKHMCPELHYFLLTHYLYRQPLVCFHLQVLPAYDKYIRPYINDISDLQTPPNSGTSFSGLI